MHGPGDVRFFDHFARAYDLVMPSAASLAAALDFAERPLDRVLDVGGGTGRATRVLDGDRVILDASPGMARRAHAKGFAVVLADARRLPVGDASVDAVVIVDALHHVPDHERVVVEATRVLAPGGVLAVREFDPRTLRGRGLVLAERLVRFGSVFLRPNELVGLFERAGLSATLVDRGFEYTVVGVKPV